MQTTLRRGYASIELKIPGKIWNGSCLVCSFNQVQRGQKWGSASSPRVFAEMRNTLGQSLITSNPITPRVSRAICAKYGVCYQGFAVFGKIFLTPARAGRLDALMLECP